MIEEALLAEAEALLALLRGAGLKVATVESCTGGLIAAALTAIPGSSDVVDCGFVTYSNEAKTDLVGVPAEVIAAYGAVSEPVARAMAEGGLARSRAGVAVSVSVTGVAGPGGGSEAKPVGLVHFGLAQRGAATRHVERRFGESGRGAVRTASVRQAFALLREAAQAVSAGRP